MQAPEEVKPEMAEEGVETAPANAGEDLYGRVERGDLGALALLLVMTADSAQLASQHLALSLVRLAGRRAAHTAAARRGAEAAVVALLGVLPAAARDVFAQTLADGLGALAAADIRTVACAARLACAAAVALADIAATPMYGALARLHTALTDASDTTLAHRRIAEAARAPLLKALSSHPPLAARFAAELHSGSATAATSPFAGLVCGATLSADRERCVRLCATLLLEAETSADTDPPRAHVDAWGALLAALTSAEFAAHVVPGVTRLLRRTPVAGLRLLCAVLRHAAAAADIDALLGLLSVELRAQEPERQTLACDALTIALAAKTTTEQTAERYVARVLKMLGGADGPLQYSAQRIGVIRALGCVLAVPTAATALPRRMAETAALQIIAFERKETNEDVKAMCIRAASVWLLRAGSDDGAGPLPQLPKEALEMLSSARLLDKEPTFNALAVCIADLVPHITDAALRTKLVSPLLKVAAVQVTKAPKAAFAGTVDALRAALTSGSDSNKLWDGPLGAASAVWHPAFFARLSEGEQVAVHKLVIEALLHHGTKVAALPEGHGWLVYNLLLSVLSSPYCAVRIAARKSCQTELFAADKTLPTRLVTAAAHRVHLFAAGFQQGKKGGPQGLLFAAQNLHQDALRAIVCPFIAPDVVPLLFVLTQHPLVASDTASQRALWHHVSHALYNPTTAAAAAASDSTAEASTSATTILPNELLDKNAQPLVALLCSPDVLCSTKEQQSMDAGVNAAITAAKTCNADDAMLRALLPALLNTVTRLVDEVIDKMTPHEIAVLLSPQGTLVPEPQAAAAAAAAAEEKKSKAVQRERKQRGEARMYSASEERWDQKVREELERKKEKSAERKAEVAEQDRAAIAAQDQQRESLAQTVSPVAKILAAIGKTCRANERAALFHMPSLFPGVIALLSRGTIVQPHAASAIWELTRCVPPPVPRVFYLPLATATVSIFTRSKDGSAVLPPRIIPIITRVLFDIAELRQLPLTAAAFAMVFPLVRAVMLQPLSAELQRAHLAGVKLLGLHTQPGPMFPRALMAQTLVHIMENFPRFIVRARTDLTQLAEGMNPDDVVGVMPGLLSQNPAVREACLTTTKKALAGATSSLSPMLALHLAMVRFDPVPENSEIAKSISTTALSNDYFERLRPFLLADRGDAGLVRKMAASAIAAAAAAHPNTVTNLLTSIIQLYKANIVALNPTTGEPEDVLTPEQVSECHAARLGLLACLTECGSAFTTFDQLQRAFKFLLSAQTLLDVEDVRIAVVEAGSRVTEAQGQGQKFIAQLFGLFDEQMAKADNLPNPLLRDRVKESLVLYVAILVRYGGQERLPRVLDQLRQLLRVQSETVQQAVASCFMSIAQLLPPEQQETTMKAMLELVVRSGGEIAERRGAAHALAGLVKGLGLASLKRFDVMSVLQSAVEDKKKPGVRQGALFAFELLSTRLGRLFEPYVIQILPKLLQCYGDPNGDVRDATGFAAKAIMSQLSAHGVKLVLPALVKATEDPSWRTKVNSVELLGSMAFCSPQQLGACLPDVVPSILVVLQDSHPDVHSAAREALQCIGSVIHNPEIRTVISAILDAIDDPTSGTRDALEALEHIDFEHEIDSASLSLVMPVVQRGLRDDTTDTKKRATQIVGNMCSLTDPRDLVPYIPSLVDKLKAILTDPSPDIRSTTAKALGSLTRGIGEEHFGDLVPWLLATMRSDKGPVERSGAAQGLSEVLGGMAPERQRSVLPGLLDLIDDASPQVREGALALFRFLPGSGSGAEFERHLERALSGVMRGAADTIETVREAATRAGMAIVSTYNSNPESMMRIALVLQTAMLDDNWRVQDASLSFLNDVLQRALATDPPLASRDPSRLLFQVVGEAPMRVLLAAVFTVRFDNSSGAVSQHAVVLWKSAVTNPPRMLLLILPQFMALLVAALSSTSQHRQLTASVALGDLVERLTTRILPEVVPTLEQALEKDDENVRQGACLGLSEVVRASGKQNLGPYSDVVFPAVRKALCDPSPRVRVVAGGLLTTLTDTMGPRVLESVISHVSKLLASGSGVVGAVAVVEAQPYPTLRALVPALIQPLPLSDFAATTLVELLSAAAKSGAIPAVEQHLRTAVVALLETDTDTSREALQRLAVGFARRLAARFVAVLTSIFGDEKGDGDDEKEEGDVEDEDEEQEKEKPENEKLKIAAISALTTFIGTTAVPLEEESETADALGSLVILQGSPSLALQEASGAAIEKFVKSTKKESFPRFLPIVRKALVDATELAGTTDALPGLCRPMGLSPLMPLFLTSLMNVATAAEASSSGDAAAIVDPNETREEAAAGLGDLVRLTTPEALAPFVVAIAGPLIRIVGDRFPAGVKSAILRTLTLLLEKSEAKLRPFVPQLQSTFVKSVRDPSFVVRSLATAALGKLVALGSRIDSLLSEILSGIGASADSADVVGTLLATLATVLAKTATTPDPKVAARVGPSIASLLGHTDQLVRLAAAEAYAHSLHFLSQDSLFTLFASDQLFDRGTFLRWQQRQARGQLIGTLARSYPILFTQNSEKLCAVIQDDLLDMDTFNVRVSAAWAAGKALGEDDPCCSAAIAGALPRGIITAISDPSVEVAIAGIKACGRFARRCPAQAKPFAAEMAASFTSRSKIATPPIKVAIADALPHIQPLL